MEVLAVPRAAVLSDQQGDYVFGVDTQNKAQRQNVKLGQSTPTVAAVTSGLKEGDRVIVEGLQPVVAELTLENRLPKKSMTADGKDAA